MAVHQTVETAVTPARRRLRVAPDRRADTRARAPERTLDGLLELLERRRLSATDLRVLLAVFGREVPVSELAQSLGRPVVEIRRTGARLYGRGLLRWRHDAASEEAVFGVTPAGLATLRPMLTTAAAGLQGVHAK